MPRQQKQPLKKSKSKRPVRSTVVRQLSQPQLPKLQETNGRNKYFALASNDEVDGCFVRLNMYYVSTENILLRKVLLDSMKEISNEIIRRDNTKGDEFIKFFNTLEIMENSNHGK